MTSVFFAQKYLPHPRLVKTGAAKLGRTSRTLGASRLASVILLPKIVILAIASDHNQQ